MIERCGVSGMKTLYLDCFSGISGDMLLGALLDLGIDGDRFIGELAKLKLFGFDVDIKRVNKYAITGVDVTVLDNEAHDYDGHTQVDAHAHEDGSAHTHEDGSAHTHEDGRAHTHEHEHGHEHEDAHAHEDGSAYTHEDGRAHAHEHEHEHEHMHVHEDAHAHADGYGHEHTHDDGHMHNGAPDRSYAQILAIIDSSDLDDCVKDSARGAFSAIAVAEAKVHNVSVRDVHFHEIGAIDSIVDIIGVCICAALLGIDEIYCSELHEGRGFVDTRHGRLPIPAPAVLEILAGSGIPIITEDIRAELVTPTGAGLAKALACAFGPMPAMRIERIGYGFGKRDTGRLNALRAVLGERLTDAPPACDRITNSTIACDRITNSTIACDRITNSTIACERITDTTIACERITDTTIACERITDAPFVGAHGAIIAGGSPASATGGSPASAAGGAGTQNIISLEANVDDMTAEGLGYAMERLFAAGALDVYFTPIQMKKNRPATLLTVLSMQETAASLTDVIFKETTTIGVRESYMSRSVMGRASEAVEIAPYETVRFKIAERNGVRRYSPEYEDCRAYAIRTGLPLAQVYEIARKCIRQSRNEE